MWWKASIAMLALLALSPTSLLAAEPEPGSSYPNRPITLIEPYALRADYGKILSASAPKFLNNQPILIEIRPGLSGAVGATLVNRARPDGYTLLLGRLASQIIQPSMHPETPYRWKDFTILGILEIDPMICAVRRDSPYKTARELLEGIRKQPGKLKYATLGVATNTHLGVQYMLHLAGLKPDAVTGVHFEAGDGAVKALMDGDVQFTCVSGVLIPYIQSGALRGLFTTAPGRLTELPQLPNATEAGLRDMGRVVGWTALLGPPGLPAEVVARWKDALNNIARDPEWLAANARFGGLPAIRSTPDPEKFMREQFLLHDQLITTLELNK